MKQNKILLPIAAGITLLFGSCNNFLDVLPDNRAEDISSSTKIAQLLVSAYPGTGYYYLGEFSSDNVDDNGPSYTSSDRLQTQSYKWQDITENGQDSPQAYWELCYLAIANANQALKLIEEAGNPESMNPQRGEALVCRAFGHFMLVNMFCKHYSERTANADMGIPYSTDLETTVDPKYERETVAAIYEKINTDLEAGLPLVSDETYSTPQYHFTRKAAYAFAARFNLYYQKYDKVIAYANKTLGNNPENILRNWQIFGTITANAMVQPNEFIKVGSPANLLLVTANSEYGAVYGSYDYGTRYTHNGRLSATETVESKGTWGSSIHFSLFNNTSLQKVLMKKMGYYFKYSDPVAGTGDPYLVWPAFTTDETLLCRAEAYVYLNDYDKATADLSAFQNAFTGGGILTRQKVNDFYSAIPYYAPNAPTVKKKLNPDFTLEDGEQENFIQCILHMRRILTLHEGLRWFDIKRYGIEIYRRTVDGPKYILTDSLKKDDLRRAIQLPQDVIDAGLAANPR